MTGILLRRSCLMALLLSLTAAAPPMHKDMDETKDDAKQIKDAEITLALEGRLARDRATPADRIDVRTDEGVVRLRGTVDNLLAQERAAALARTLKGVRAVVNQIEVKPASRSDDAIRQDVEGAMLLDPAADGYEVAVKASGGKVTLTGTVQSWAEKQLAGEIARGVKGVRQVENDLEIEYKRQRPDHEIRADVQARLASDVWLDDGLIDVTVEGGKVTLSGTVGSAAEKTRASGRAWVAGVKEVAVAGLKVDQWWQRDRLRRKGPSAYRSDEQIEKAVKDAFFYDPRVVSFRPTVSVSGGVVTLTGTVDNLKAKQAAEQDARDTRGVRRVKNYLKVRPANKPPSDAELARSIRSALLWDPYVSGYEVRVTVSDGRARLSGTVDSYYEKWRAGDVAARINGVVGVSNHLYVDYDLPPIRGPYYPDTYRYDSPVLQSRLDDEEIRDDVRAELWWSPFVDANQVRVSVEAGVATLTGTVDSDRERRAAVENALEGGARNVVNNLKVREGNDSR